MISVRDFSVTYTPGMGYSAKPKDDPDSNVSICWGEEFQKNLKEMIAKRAEEYRAEQEEFQRASLSREEIEELAGRFDPHKMSQSEYDQFLDILAGKGVLSQREIRQMGYNGLVEVCPDDEYKYGRFVNCADPLAKSVTGNGNLFGAGGMNGDVLSWTKLKSLGILGNGKDNPAYTAMLEVLNQVKDSPAARTAETGGNSARTKLSNADIAQLAKKYDPHKMTQESYDSFLKDLIGSGALTMRDAALLGYGGLVAAGADPEELREKGAWLGPVYELKGDGFPPGEEQIRSLQDADGDLSRWLAAQMLWKALPDDRPSVQQYIKAREDAFQNLSDILSRMDAYR